MPLQMLPPAAAWLIVVVLVEAAVIDGRLLRVPNWLTFHLALGGLAFWAWTAGASGLALSMAGLVVGLALLMPLHAIGGMGAGDVKLLAGVGAWVGVGPTLGAFATSAIVGGVIAVGMIAWRGAWRRHGGQMLAIGRDIVAVRDPAQLSREAAERKPRMLLLPYGIPLAIGSIGYFAWLGLLS